MFSTNWWFRGLAGHGLEQAQILRSKLALLLVKHLQNADDLLLDSTDRRAQDVLRDIARLLVDRAVETGVGVSVLDDDALALGVHIAGDPLIVEDPDFAKLGALGDTRVQLAGILIVQKQGAPVGAGFGRADVDDRRKQLVERIDDRNLLGDAEQ